MTRDEWDDLCKQLNLAWPNAPLSQNQSNVYFATLRDLDREEASNAIVTLVRSGADTVPPPRRILRVAMDARSGAGDTTNVTLVAATAATRAGGPPPGKLVVTAPAAAEATTPQGGVAAPAEADGWLRRNARILVGGIAVLVVGVGIGVGIAFIVAPNADKAFAQGKAEGIDIGDTRGYKRGYSSGHDDGYSSGKSDGYSSGLDDGKTAVFTSMTGAAPIDGEFYIVRYSSSSGISYWWDTPIQTGECVSISYSGGDSYQLSRSGFSC